MKAVSTLRRTLSLHFLLAAVLPALLFGLIAIALLHNHLQTGIYERNRSVSRDIAAVTEQFLKEVEVDLGSIGKAVEDDLGDRPVALNSFLGSIVFTSRRFESLYLLDQNRRVVGLGVDPRVREQQADYLNIDFSSLDIFRKHPVITGPVWSDTFISVVSGVPSVTLVLPVRQGLLLGNVRLTRLSQELQLVSSRSSSIGAIVDHNGTLIASSEMSLVMQRANFNPHAIIPRTLEGSEGTILENHDDRSILESTETVPRTGWVAWVGVDLGAEMAPVVHMRNLLAGILVLALLIAAGIALFDARQLLMPLLSLSERAGQIGAGHYEFLPEASGFAEIDQLSERIHDMAGQVRDREASILASGKRFRELVNSIDGIVWEMDILSGRYLFISERSAAMFGYPPEQWIADPGFWASHVYEEDRERVVFRGRPSLGFNHSHNLEYRFVTAAGRPVWVRDLVTIIWEDDEPIRLLGVMIDINERKRIEAELESYQIGLEELVEQRSRELQAAQAELVRKERLAVLGQLTATVSHEIRNPLGTVANALYLMREALGPDCLARMERPLALAERSVQRCDGIISELLDFTRRRELQCETVALDQWLSGVLGEMAWPDGLRYQWQLESGVTVAIDAERLRRALINVIDNAVQAMEEKGEGESILKISTRRLAGRGEIVIEDNGAGIPEEIQGRIFEPLFSTKNFGVGLGVPIICNIMTDHGGGVDYRSRVGEGTTVTLWLPLAPDPEAAVT